MAAIPFGTRRLRAPRSVPSPSRARSAVDDRNAESAAAHRPTRIVQLYYTVQDRGGEMVGQLLAEGFRARGIDTITLGASRNCPPTVTTADWEVLYEHRPSALGNLRYVFDVWRRLRRERPDAVVMHSDLAMIMTAPAALLAGVPVRIAVHHLALGIFYRPFRWVHVLYGLLRLNTHPVFVGESARRDADRLPKAFQRRCHTIPNAVLVPRGTKAEARRRFGIADDAFVFSSVGSLREQKNQTLLVDAMRDIDDAILVIAGGGELREQLEAQAAPLGDRVRFLGNLEGDDVGLAYRVADAFVFPSLYEGRPLSLIEAAMAELPIVASPIPENVEITADAAVYVATDDRDGWVAAMRRLRADAVHRAEVQARVAALDLGTADDMVDAYLDLIR
jgi:glycosyltransferase involved in cell wall biosynthesis